MADFYDADTGEFITHHKEYLRRKVFYIHGTKSEPSRWKKWEGAVTVLNKIAKPYPDDAVDTDFDWKEEATQLNNLKDRWPVSDRLVKYIKEKALANNYSEIVLIGHSHGGNVAIMAADKLAEDPAISRIYVITIGTPVFNKMTFTTLSQITGFKVANKITKIRIMTHSMTAHAFTSYPYDEYVYDNPENPANWVNKNKIKHLSIYNEYDRVDGVAQAGNKFIENSRMTADTSTFQYNKDINKGLKSKLTTNEVNRAKYCNYCLYHISALMRLRELIKNVEIYKKESLGQRPVENGQDNLRVVQYFKDIEISYRKITAKLPSFRAISLNQFLSNDMLNIKNSNVNNMALSELWSLFTSDYLFTEFTSQFSAESTSPLQKNYPYEVVDMDFRSPNLKMIDEQIEKLTLEIERVKDFNRRTNEDKFQNSEWYLSYLYYGSMGRMIHFPIRYLFEGINDHGFDMNSPELIQQAIDSGYIKPFNQVRQESID